MKKTIIAILAFTFLCAGLGLAQAEAPLRAQVPGPQVRAAGPEGLPGRLRGRPARLMPKRTAACPSSTSPRSSTAAASTCRKTRPGSTPSSAISSSRAARPPAKDRPFEDRIDFLGGTLNFNVGERTSTLTLSVLTKDLDEGLATFFDVLRNPAFREEPLKLAKARFVEQLRQANDQPNAVLSREYERLLYGDNAVTWQPTKATYERHHGGRPQGLPRQVLLAEERHPGRFGRFRQGRAQAQDRQARRGLEGRMRSSSRRCRRPSRRRSRASISSRRPSTRATSSLGHLGLEDTNPDYFAVQVMNFILGGGSFTSRITTKVRSDEGLSYNQGSRFTYRWGLPGTFSGYVQTKSSTVGYAISLILAEFDRIRKEPGDATPRWRRPSTTISRASPTTSSPPQSTMMSFANLEMTGKPMDYYKTYRSKIQAVTKARVQDVADEVHPSGQDGHHDRRRLGALQQGRRQVARPARQAGQGPPDRLDGPDDGRGDQVDVGSEG